MAQEIMDAQTFEKELTESLVTAQNQKLEKDTIDSIKRNIDEGKRLIATARKARQNNNSFEYVGDTEDKRFILVTDGERTRTVSSIYKDVIIKKITDAPMYKRIEPEFQKRSQTVQENLTNKLSAGKYVTNKLFKAYCENLHNGTIKRQDKILVPATPNIDGKDYIETPVKFKISDINTPGKVMEKTWNLTFTNKAKFNKAEQAGLKGYNIQRGRVHQEAGKLLLKSLQLSKDVNNTFNYTPGRREADNTFKEGNYPGLTIEIEAEGLGVENNIKLVGTNAINNFTDRGYEPQIINIKNDSGELQPRNISSMSAIQVAGIPEVKQMFKQESQENKEKIAKVMNEVNKLKKENISFQQQREQRIGNKRGSVKV